jgi:hypothetical protein
MFPLDQMLDRLIGILPVRAGLKVAVSPLLVLLGERVTIRGCLPPSFSDRLEAVDGELGSFWAWRAVAH